MYLYDCNTFIVEASANAKFEVEGPGFLQKLQKN
jgi:hypothetical protein